MDKLMLFSKGEESVELWGATIVIINILAIFVCIVFILVAIRVIRFLFILEAYKLAAIAQGLEKTKGETYDTIDGWMVWSPIADDFIPYSQGDVVAWMPLPPAFKEEE